MNDPETIIQQLFQEFDIPKPLFQIALEHFKNNKSLQKPNIYGILDSDNAPKAYEKLKAEMDDIDFLLLYLFGARECKQRYIQLGIPMDVYRATMACFSRFINETYRCKGVYTFDRHGWAYRQISLRLFRIGELEYEFIDGDIAIHIPSDAKFSPDKIQESLSKMHEFIKHYFAANSNARVTCFSWLLSPEIACMVPFDSHILSFQSLFDISAQDEPSNEFLFWLFGVELCQNFNQLSEQTSLQKKVKQHLLQGGVIHNGFGILKERE